MHANPDSPSSTSFRLRLDIQRLPGIRKLAVDYVSAYGRVADFYAGSPASPAGWKEAIDRARGSSRDRTALAGVLARQLEGRHAPSAALEAARRLGDPDAVAILTGQQAGLFGGPLYTLLKALTAMKLARDLSSREGVPVVPVFWIDAEDHDWEEVRTCRTLDPEYQLAEARVGAPAGAGEAPVSAVKLDDSVADALSTLEGTFAATEFTAGLLADLRASYRPGVSLVEAFAAWMDRLLGARGLVVFDSSDPRAKPLASSVFVRELSNPGGTAVAARAAGERLEALGYQPQVHPQPDAVAVFRLDGRRAPITAGDAPSLVADAQADPSRFSPNVLLRPVVQDTIFPTAGYVGGPSELAYLGQLKEVYRQFGVPMPLIYPRTTATLVDAPAARFLERYGIPFEAFQARDESALNRLLEAQLPESVEQAFAAAEAAVDQHLEALSAAVGQVDPTLAGAAQSTRGRIEKDLRSLHSKMLQAAKRKDETLRRQFARAQAQMFPGGHLQERTLGFVYFLNRYGPALVDRLLDELPLEMGPHWVLAP